MKNKGFFGSTNSRIRFSQRYKLVHGMIIFNLLTTLYVENSIPLQPYL